MYLKLKNVLKNKIIIITSYKHYKIILHTQKKKYF